MRWSWRVPEGACRTALPSQPIPRRNRIEAEPLFINLFLGTYAG